MNWYEFSKTNRERCESPKGFNHAINSWSLSDWITALVGELGEAANVAKKLNRVRDGIPGNTVSADELRSQFARELADTFIYLDLTAQAAGIDLPAVVAAVFNAKSEQIGSPIRFGVPVTAAVGEHTPGPWKVGLGGFIREDRADAKRRETGESLAVLNSDRDTGCKPEPELRANGRLMAASPDLLAALKAARKAWLHEAAQGDGIAEKHAPVLAQIDAAIAKAEGGAA